MATMMDILRAKRQGFTPPVEDDMGDGEVAPLPDPPLTPADDSGAEASVDKRALEFTGDLGNGMVMDVPPERPADEDAAPASAEEVIARYGNGDDAPEEKRIAPQIMASEPEEPQRDPPPTWITRLGDRMQVAGTPDHRKPDFTEADRIDSQYAGQLKSDAQKAADARARAAFPTMAKMLGPNAGAAEILAAIKAREPQAQREFQEQQGELNRANTAEIARQNNAAAMARARLPKQFPPRAPARPAGAGADGEKWTPTDDAGLRALSTKIQKLDDPYLLLKEIRDSYGNGSAAPELGRAARFSAKYLGGAMLDDEQQAYVATLKNFADTVKRARSGAAVTGQETATYDQILGLNVVSNPALLPKAIALFQKKLDTDLSVIKAGVRPKIVKQFESGDAEGLHPKSATASAAVEPEASSAIPAGYIEVQKDGKTKVIPQQNEAAAASRGWVR